MAFLPTVIYRYGPSGPITERMKTWEQMITPSASNGFIVDISSADFDQITNVQITVGRNTTTPTSVPNISIKSITTTQLILNITQPNSTTVNILGINVLSGAAAQWATSISDITIHIKIEGY